MQGGQQQSSATDQSLETAQQDAWQLFAQGTTPMHSSPSNVPQIDHGYTNATEESSAGVMLSHNLNGGEQDLYISRKEENEQMNRR